MPIPLLLAAAPAIASGVANIVQGIGSADQLKKDKAELARLKTPFYKIQDEYYQNQNQATELAQGGYTQAAKDLFTDTAGRGLSTSISGVLQAGGDPNDIAKVFAGYNDAVRNFAAEDAEKQIANIRYLHGVNKDMAGQKTTQWGINEYEPYRNKLKELTERIAADKTNIWNSVQGAIGSAQAGITAASNAELMNSFAGKNNAQAKLFGKLFSDPATGKVVDMTTDAGENYNRPAMPPDDKTAAVQKLAAALSPEELQDLLGMLSESQQYKIAQ